MTSIKVFFALLLTGTAITGALAQTREAAAGHSVDTFITNKMKALKIPGIAVGIVKDGKIIKVATYGKANIEWNENVTEHTNFQIASCTKLLTSTLLVKAIYQGKIKLSDRVGQYIDSIPTQWADLQVKHLISHSSGIRNFYGDYYLPTAAVVKALKDSTLEYSPGNGQHYSLFDFMLLGHILEKIYNKPFPQLLHDEVTVPLGMNDGAFDMEDRVGSFLRTEIVPQKATTYYESNGKLVAYKYLYPQYSYTAGGYYASITDMVNWAIGLDNEMLFPKTFSYELFFGRDSIRHAQSGFTRAGWASGDEGNFIIAGHSGGPGLGDILRFPAFGYTIIVLSNDGELLPGMARSVAHFYIKDLPAINDIEKFDR